MRGRIGEWKGRARENQGDKIVGMRGEKREGGGEERREGGCQKP